MRRSSNAVRRQPIELINCIEKAKDARNVLSLENAGTRDSIHTVRVKMQLALRCFLRSRPVFLVGTTYRSKTHLDFRTCKNTRCNLHYLFTYDEANQTHLSNILLTVWAHIYLPHDAKFFRARVFFFLLAFSAREFFRTCTHGSLHVVYILLINYQRTINQFNTLLNRVSVASSRGGVVSEVRK